MSGPLIWVALFLGNAALLVLWVHYIIKVLVGECPHCGESRKSPVAGLLQSFRDGHTKA